MNLQEFEIEFTKLGNDYKTKDVDRFNRALIKRGVNVSFLRDIVLDKQEYHRTYFQVSMGQIKGIEGKLKFIEDNSGNFDIYNDIVDESMVITCVNFNGFGTGLKHPVHIADTDGKAIYLMFSSTLVGSEENKTRSVKYTIFQEK